MRRKRPITLLTISLLSLASLIYLIFNYSPTQEFQILNFSRQLRDPATAGQFSTIYVFFLLVFIFIYSTIAYLLINTKQGLLFGLFATGYLFLRFIHLTHPFFLILLLVLFISLELFFKKRI